ncbi:P-loop containing nucleoside triphosphate hydrolase protein [Obelidium mucronatum]|nr:P-loop containing nucleoside triphosphate hydrolase protein [Obelidium mucronatum]
MLVFKQHLVRSTRRLARCSFRLESTWSKHPSIASNEFLRDSIQNNFGYDQMTPVQKQVLDAVHHHHHGDANTLAATKKRDMLVRAKTGTGKTLAFLVAAMQTVFRNPEKTAGISILVFSPTRELAVQTAAEARKLLDIEHHPNHRHHKTKSHHNVTVVVGGERKDPQIDGILNRPPRDYRFSKNSRKGTVDEVSSSKSDGGIEIVVATPGRMLDLVDSVDSVRERLRNVQVVILDEADQLLDMGFQKTIQAILECVPQPHKRHTFMFSATLSSPAVRSLAAQQLVNKPIHEIDTTSIPSTDGSTTSLTQNSRTATISDSIHAHVPQSYALLDYKHWAFSLYKLLLVHVSRHNEKSAATNGTTPPARVVVFFNTSKHAAYFAKIFKNLPGLCSASEGGRFSASKSDSKLSVYELHARLEQSKRSRISDAFRANNKTPSVLFTTDVSARGVDYPDVSLVIQVGCPSNAEQYVHRVGRTGRAGKSGEGVLLCEPYERGFLKSLENGSGVVGNEEIDSWTESEDAEDVKLRNAVTGAFKKAVEYDVDPAEGCYSAYLGYYTQQKFVSKAGVGLAAERFARDLLLTPETPSLSMKLATQMGVVNIRGINVRGGGSDRFGSSSRGGRGGDFGSRGENTSNSFDRRKDDFNSLPHKKEKAPWEGRGKIRR